MSRNIFRDGVHWHRPVKPAVIIADQRVGGTFLASCLDSHPDIHCERGEPLNSISPEQVLCGMSPYQALKHSLTHTHFLVSMLKITYNQCAPWVLDYIKINNVKVIHLIRQNVIATAISERAHQLQLNGQIRQPTHLYDDGGASKFEIKDPEKFVEFCRTLYRRQNNLKETLAQFKPLTLYYEDLTGNEESSGIYGEQAETICKFLGVPYQDLAVGRLRKMHTMPYAEVVTNWTEVERLLKETRFAKYL